jgi:hypothetical protein
LADRPMTSNCKHQIFPLFFILSFSFILLHISPINICWFKLFIKLRLFFLQHHAGLSTFIEPLAVLPTEHLSFNSELFYNKSNKELLYPNPHDPFQLLEYHYFATASLQQNTYEVRFEQLFT